MCDCFADAWCTIMSCKHFEHTICHRPLEAPDTMITLDMVLSVSVSHYSRDSLQPMHQEMHILPWWYVIVPSGCSRIKKGVKPTFDLSTPYTFELVALISLPAFSMSPNGHSVVANICKTLMSKYAGCPCLCWWCFQLEQRLFLLSTMLVLKSLSNPAMVPTTWHTCRVS